ncbi:IclR family transcriptional regulator domain-containing protein [Blastococcus sp. SYSU DS0619]
MTDGKPEPAAAAQPGLISKFSMVIDLLTIHEDLSIADLAYLAGEPRSSMYRLVKALTSVGFVEVGASRGRVRLGAKLFKIGQAAGRRYDIRRLALPILIELREQTGVTVYLCVREDFDALCVERVEGKGAHLLSLRTGTSIPLHLGAAAKVLLAYGGPSLWDAYARHVEEGGGVADHIRGVLEQHLSPQLVALKEEMEEIRLTGLSVSNSDVVLGVAALGAPVRDEHGAVCAAISIGGEARHVLGESKERNELLVRRAAQKLSAALGFAPDVAGGPSSGPGPSPVPVIGRVSHVGLVVHDLDDAKVRHCGLVGGRAWRTLEYGPSTVGEMTYRGRAVSSTVAVATAEGPDGAVDLVSPVAGVNIHRDWLEERGEGFHYVNVPVESLDEAVDTMRRGGFSVVQSGRSVTNGAEFAYAFFDTAGELGYVTRASQR